MVRFRVSAKVRVSLIFFYTAKSTPLFVMSYIYSLLQLDGSELNCSTGKFYDVARLLRITDHSEGCDAAVGGRLGPGRDGRYRRGCHRHRLGSTMAAALDLACIHGCRGSSLYAAYTAAFDPAHS